MSVAQKLGAFFLAGYGLSLIGMTTEDIIAGQGFISSLSDIHHQLFSIIFGCICCALGYQITKGKAALSEAMDQFNQVIEQSPSVFELYDIHGLQIEVNKAYETLWKFPEGRERTLRKFNVLMSKEVEATGLIDYIKKAYAGELVTLPPYKFDPSGETEAKGAGRVRWLNTKIYPLKKEGKVSNIVITHEDISERKQAEEKLDWELHVNKSLAELGHTLIAPGLSIHDVAEKVLARAQDLTASVHGYVSELDRDSGEHIYYAQTAMMDKSCDMRAPDQSSLSSQGDATCSKVWRHGLKSGKPFFTNSWKDQPHPFGLPEGDILIDRFLCVPVVYHDKVIGQIALVNPTTDYTERHVEAIQRLADLYALAIYRNRSKKRRIEMEAHLQQAHKMEAIGTLAGGIAHDFNNLLAIINGNLEVLQRKISHKQNPAENIQHAKDAVDRAIGLVRQILSFSRQEKHELVPLNISTTIEDSLKLLRSTIPSTVEILNTTAGEAPLINADSVQLQQVIINLCTNAVQAMDEKGLLSVGLEEVWLTDTEIPPGVNPQEGHYAKLSVGDTGCGMDQQTIARIFEPFYTTKEVGQGTGMGLSMVHGIVEQHAGFITVESTPGQGSTFSVYFPRLGRGGGDNMAVVAAPFPGGTEHILFVDDEKQIAAIAAELLGSRGYKVTSVSSSREAFEIFKAGVTEFDLIITDQTMPEMSGVELARKILNIRSNIPIILCSGYSTMVTEAEAMRIGIREFCLKPLDMEQLCTVTRRVLDGNGGQA